MKKDKEETKENPVEETKPKSVDIELPKGMCLVRYSRNSVRRGIEEIVYTGYALMMEKRGKLTIIKRN